MFYQRIRAKVLEQVQEIRSAAAEQISRAKKHPAGIAVLYAITFAEVGALQAAVFGLKALAYTLHGIGAIVERISKEDGPGPLLLEDHQRTEVRTLSERIGDAWKFRADIMRECRGCMNV